MGEPDQHVPGVALADQGAAADAVLPQVVLPPREDLPLACRAARGPVALRVAAVALVGLTARVDAQQDQLRLEAPRELDRHLHGFAGGARRVDADGDRGEHQGASISAPATVVHPPPPATAPAPSWPRITPTHARSCE